MKMKLKIKNKVREFICYSFHQFLKINQNEYSGNTNLLFQSQTNIKKQFISEIIRKIDTITEILLYVYKIFETLIKSYCFHPIRVYLNKKCEPIHLDSISIHSHTFE